MREGMLLMLILLFFVIIFNLEPEAKCAGNIAVVKEFHNCQLGYGCVIKLDNDELVIVNEPVQTGMLVVNICSINKPNNCTYKMQSAMNPDYGLKKCKTE